MPSEKDIEACQKETLEKFKASDANGLAAFADPEMYREECVKYLTMQEEKHSGGRRHRKSKKAKKAKKTKKSGKSKKSKK